MFKVFFISNKNIIIELYYKNLGDIDFFEEKE